MKYHIEVKEVYGRDQHYKPEMVITNGKSYNRDDAQHMRDLLQKYSNSVKYKVARN